MKTGIQCTKPIGQLLRHDVGCVWTTWSRSVPISFILYQIAFYLGTKRHPLQRREDIAWVSVFKVRILGIRQWQVSIVVRHGLSPENVKIDTTNWNITCYMKWGSSGSRGLLHENEYSGTSPFGTPIFKRNLHSRGTKFGSGKMCIFFIVPFTYIDENITQVESPFNGYLSTQNVTDHWDTTTTSNLFNKARHTTKAEFQVEIRDGW